jgi:hypothetical protein
MQHQTMDLQQRKLTRDEWNSIEIPVPAQEKRILELIKAGYHDVSTSRNYTNSLLRYLKIKSEDHIVQYVFTQYLQPELRTLAKKYDLSLDEIKFKKRVMKKGDIIRFSNTEKQLDDYKSVLFEYVLIELLGKMYMHRGKGSSKWLYYYYTLRILVGYRVEDFNKFFQDALNRILDKIADEVTPQGLVTMAYELIEKNDYLLRFADEELYGHQKQLFTAVKRPNPKLILYIAPTGTGKTLSPLGLSEEYRVIFVCAARHVGLALAKAAISTEKKVAFAFGCADANDIRLHYFAAKDYIRNRRSGKIAKVDNSVGDKVEIMISDIKSYIPAMLYMLAFNPKEKIILYWDEPTITMDYDDHEFHKIIKKNWSENLIPNVVLSSATLPQSEDLTDTTSDFRGRFLDSEITTIVSHDCKKTIPLITKTGYVAMPHYMCEDYDEVLQVVTHCQKYKTLLRYIDLGEAVKFIIYVNDNGHVRSSRFTLERHFPSLESVTMGNIKLYYLEVLGNLKPESWPAVKAGMVALRRVRQPSNIHVVTTDAATLTDGPTIFLADNVDKIAKFCIQSAKIPGQVMNDIVEAIQYNSVINENVGMLQKNLEDGTKKDEGKEKKMAEGRVDPDMKRLMIKIQELQNCVRTVALNPMFVPNTQEHIRRFGQAKQELRPFTSDISEHTVEQIMLIDDIDDSWKMLLLMGIGVFASHNSDRYTEVMKHLAQTQRLYLIIASTDFIYGTNYQFCHGYVSKDLGSMSQEKCIQAMGRVGRNKLQQDYTMRFRDDDLIDKLFHEEEDKPEVRNMSRLFNSAEEEVLVSSSESAS